MPPPVLRAVFQLNVAVRISDAQVAGVEDLNILGRAFRSIGGNKGSRVGVAFNVSMGPKARSPKLA